MQGVAMRKVLFAIFMFTLGCFAFAKDITPGSIVHIGLPGGGMNAYVTSIKKTNGILEVKFFTEKGFELVFNEVTPHSFPIFYGISRDTRGYSDIENSKNDVLVLTNQ